MRLGGDIYGVDLHLPYCNNNQLLNIFGGGAGDDDEEEAEEVCYVDGTGRQVCQPKLIKRLCSEVVEEWGLKSVYC